MTDQEKKKMRKSHVSNLVEAEKKLDALANDINKLFKDEGLICRMEEGGGATDLSQGCYSTGYPAIDDVITGGTDEEGRTIPGTGKGFPKGRIVEVVGPEACLCEDTYIQYEVRRPNGFRQNHKGGTIKRLYEAFNRLPLKGKGNFHRSSTLGSEYYVSSVNEDDRIFQNNIEAVSYAGVKPCYRLTTGRGHKLVCTGDHKIYTGSGYLKLDQLKIGDSVYVHERVPYRADVKKQSNRGRVYLFVKSHPVAGTKVIAGRYVYKHLVRSRAVVEAHMNGLSLEEYVDRLNSCELDNLVFLDRSDHVHHNNEDHTDDRLENLVVLSGREHNRQHAIENHNNLRFIAVEDTVRSIVPVGKRRTYDIRMRSPFNNYVANGVVVHNSGKSSMALMVVADCQRKGGSAVYIDAEHALDITYAKSLGVDVKRLLIAQPDAGEDALELVKQCVRRKVDVVVVDSVAALVPRRQLESAEGDSVQPGAQALMMSMALKRITVLLKRGGPLVIFINQLRNKIGVRFGNPEIPAGGKALGYYASVRFDLRKVKQIKDGSRVVGVCIRAKIIKNRVAPPFREVWYYIKFNKGIEVPSKAEVNLLMKKAAAAEGDDE